MTIYFANDSKAVVSLIDAIKKSANAYHAAGIELALTKLASDDFKVKDHEGVFAHIETATDGEVKAGTVKTRVVASMNAIVRVVEHCATAEQIAKFCAVKTTSRLENWLKLGNVYSRSMAENFMGAVKAEKEASKALEAAKVKGDAAAAQLAVNKAADTLKVVESKWAGLDRTLESSLATVAGFDTSTLKPVEKPVDVDEGRVKDIKQAEGLAYLDEDKRQNEGRIENVETAEKAAYEERARREAPTWAEVISGAVDTNGKPANGLTQDRFDQLLGQLLTEGAQANLDVKGSLNRALKALRELEKKAA